MQDLSITMSFYQILGILVWSHYLIILPYLYIKIFIEINLNK